MTVDAYLGAGAERRRLLCNQAQAELGLRHYYDLWCLIRQGVAGRAAQDSELFRRAAEHRELFLRWTWMDYGTLRPGALRLVPSTDQIAGWRTDYDVMRGEMFFGVTPDFEEILREVGKFEHEFNRTGGGVGDGRQGRL